MKQSRVAPPCQAVNKTCVAAKENEWRVTEGVVSHMQQSSRKSAALPLPLNDHVWSTWPLPEGPRQPQRRTWFARAVAGHVARCGSRGGRGCCTRCCAREHQKDAGGRRGRLCERQECRTRPRQEVATSLHIPWTTITRCFLIAPMDQPSCLHASSRCPAPRALARQTPREF